MRQPCRRLGLPERRAMTTGIGPEHVCDVVAAQCRVEGLVHVERSGRRPVPRRRRSARAIGPIRGECRCQRGRLPARWACGEPRFSTCRPLGSVATKYPLHDSTAPNVWRLRSPMLERAVTTGRQSDQRAAGTPGDRVEAVVDARGQVVADRLRPVLVRRPVEVLAVLVRRCARPGARRRSRARGRTSRLWATNAFCV